MQTPASSSAIATRLIVFSDLDGTLLDHKDYGYGPAVPTLTRLARNGIPLILASSKTAAEMIPLRAELGLEQWPLMCENGAGVVHASTDAGLDEDYQRLRSVLNGLPPELRSGFEGFGDMGAERIAELTGLPLFVAKRAAQRQFSEPGIWSGTDDAAQEFLKVLASHGVSTNQGGRFLTLSFGSNKVDHMRQIAEGLGRDQSIALGDAPNDAEMLQAATHAIVMPNAAGAEMPALRGPQIRHGSHPGPRGWAYSLGVLLSELGVPA